jgi:hypothetical protein
LLIAAFILAPVICFGQVEISPQSREVRPNKSGEAAGNLYLKNDDAKPWAWTVEPQTFSVDEWGNNLPASLKKAGIRLELSESSGSLPAKSRRLVSYRITCKTTCWLALNVSFSQPQIRAAETVGVAIGMQHIIYVASEPLHRNDIYLSQTGLDELKITNTGPGLGRLVSLKVGDREVNGFLLFPNSSRRVYLEGAEDRPIVARFAEFSVSLGETHWF